MLPRKQFLKGRWSVSEQVEYKAKVRSAGLETAIYDPEKDGSEFREWFGAKPSRIGRERRIKAVKVIARGLTQEGLKSVSEEDLQRITKEFQDKRAEGDRAVTRDFIQELAVKHQFTTGKWMVMVHERFGDRLWEDMATALLEGRFPESVTSVRANLFDARGSETRGVIQ